MDKRYIISMNSITSFTFVFIMKKTKQNLSAIIIIIKTKNCLGFSREPRGILFGFGRGLVCHHQALKTRFPTKTPQVRQAKRSAASTREGQRPHHSSLTVITALDHSTDFLEIYTYFDQRLPNDT